MRNKKVILDTNLWLSFLISKRLKALDSLIDNGKLKLIFSYESLEEFLTVVRRPKFQKYFTITDIEELIRLFDKYGKLVKVNTLVTDCRDAKDNFLLSLAIDSKADYLITGDDDLLILKQMHKTQICTWSEFLSVVNQ